MSRSSKKFPARVDRAIEQTRVRRNVLSKVKATKAGRDINNNQNNLPRVLQKDRSLYVCIHLHCPSSRLYMSDTYICLIVLLIAPQMRKGQKEEKPLHPSWAAKKMLKEKQNPSIVAPQGKKIVF